MRVRIMQGNCIIAFKIFNNILMYYTFVLVKIVSQFCFRTDMNQYVVRYI